MYRDHSLSSDNNATFLGGRLVCLEVCRSSSVMKTGQEQRNLCIETIL